MNTNTRPSLFSRRQFVGGTLAAAALTAVTPRVGFAQGAPGRKIKLGVVGCGGRGSWISGLFKQHGGYEMWAVADYFQEVASQCGDSLGVDRSRQFATLSGYKRLLESGVEAVALEVPPYFLPEMACAAVEAGKHVYMAKPISPDVPGALRVLGAGKSARQKRQCFMVDYQMPTDPVNIEVVKCIHSEEFGKISQLATVGVTNGFPDPAFTENLESRLRGLIWVNDIAMGCDYIGNYDIHCIDAALWVAGQRPVAASGASSICRNDPHGDSRDVCSVVYEYANGLVHNHLGEALNNKVQGELSCRVHGQKGNALVNYWGTASLRSFDDAYSGNVENLYEAGAKRNIATFHKNVTEGQFENPTLERSVDGVLTCVLGREAGIRRTRLTMEQVIQENKRLEVNLKGLKA